jgi:transcriptional regulator with XRE-family HTH domain
MSDERKQFGKLLRRLRDDDRLTLRELAKRSKVPFTGISAIEHGRAIAGMKTATKLADGLKLRAELRDSFILAASISSRKVNPAQGDSSPIAPFLRALPWIMQRIGQEFGEFAEVSICNLPELPEGKSDVVILFEDKNLAPHLHSTHVLKAEVREYLQSNTNSHHLAILVRTDRSQTVITCGSRTFA